jgi:hypothetical protein
VIPATTTSFVRIPNSSSKHFSRALSTWSKNDDNLPATEFFPYLQQETKRSTNPNLSVAYLPAYRYEHGLQMLAAEQVRIKVWLQETAYRTLVHLPKPKTFV